MPETNNHIKFLQTLSEAELTELVIMPLLEKMNYREIRYTHGISERGKDIVFVREDQLAGPQYQAAAIKSRPLVGSVSSSKSIHEILFQLQQALHEPYILPLNGRPVHIEKVFCITPFAISTTTMDSIAAQMRELANRVQFIDGPQLLTLLLKHVPDLLISLPDPESRYLHQLCSRFLRATPLGSLGESQQLTVHDLFVSASISRIDMEQARFISFAQPDDVKTNRLSYKTICEGKNAVLIADVGSGKTTLMQRLLIDTAKAEKPLTDSPLPLFVPLAHFKRSDIASAFTFKSALEHFVKEQYGLSISKPNARDSREILFLLDGFDELVSDHDIVTAVVTDLSNQAGVRVIMTSRPSRVPYLPNFAFLRVNPFNDDNVSEFLQKWFAENPQLANEVSEHIRSNAALSDLCRTPLMLTLYAILSSQGVTDSLPTRRTDVYRTVVEMLLGRWDILRKIRNNFSADVKQQVLETLAIHSHRRQERRFNKYEVMNFGENILRSRRGRVYRSEEPEMLFLELVFRSSLIRQTSESNWDLEFAHLSFQEYFAALALHRKGSGRDVSLLLEDEWWKNTLRFYFGTFRSLDSVLGSLRTKKARHGLGLRLLEFLSEADYTEPSGRKKVFQIVARDLVSFPITENELAICRRLGNDVVEALDSTIDDPPAVWIPPNVFRILLEISTSQAHLVLLRAERFLDQLNVEELVEVLLLFLKRVRLEGNQQFLRTGLQLVVHKHTIASYAKSKRDLLVLIDRVRRTMTAAHVTKSKRDIEELLTKIRSLCQ